MTNACTMRNTENNVFLRKTFSSIIGFLYICNFGLILSLCGPLGEISNNPTIAKWLFAGAALGNFMCMLLKLELVLNYMLSGVLIMSTSLASLYFCKGHFYPIIKNEALAWKCNLIFVFYGISVGNILNITPAYITQLAPESLKTILLSGIGGLGIVGGVTAGKIISDCFKKQILLYSIIGYVSILIICTMGCLKQYPTGSLNLKYFKNIMTRGKKSVIMIGLCHFIQQVSGINHIVLDAEEIFKYNGEFNYWFSIGSSILAMTVTLLSSYLFKNTRRIPVMTVSLTIIFAANFLFSKKEILSSTIVAYFFILGFNMGLGSIPYIYIAELFPAENVQEGALIATSVNYFSGLASILMAANSSNYLMFNVCIVIFLIIYLIIMPETKNRKSSFI